MKIKAAIATSANTPLSIETVDLEGPKAGEVLIDLKASGVCHTDALAMTGMGPGAALPQVLGHEGAGIVADVGPGVTTLKPGDHVIPLYAPECGQCPTCLSGRTNVCVGNTMAPMHGLMADGSTRLSLDGQQIHHFFGTSTFAQMTVVPENAVAKIDPQAPFDTVCAIGCAVTTGVGAAIYVADVKPGSSVAIFGLGGIGLNAIQGARIAGAERIVGIDINPEREGIARALGMTDFVDASSVPNVVEAVKELTQGGADTCFECTGVPAVLGQAVHASNMFWGHILSIGVSAPTDMMPVSSLDLIMGRKIEGLYFGGAKGRSDVPKIVDMYMRGDIQIDPLITHRLPLEEINTAFDLMHSGEAIRSVVMLD